MRIHVDQPVLTIEGEPFQPPSTLRAAIFHALLNALPEDQNMELDKKLKIHQLAQTVLKGTTEKIGTLEITASVINLNSEQLVLIKQRANKTFQIHFLGQMMAMLEREWEPPGPFESNAGREINTYQPEEQAVHLKAMDRQLS